MGVWECCAAKCEGAGPGRVCTHEGGRERKCKHPVLFIVLVVPVWCREMVMAVVIMGASVPTRASHDIYRACLVVVFVLMCRC